MICFQSHQHLNSHHLKYFLCQKLCPFSQPGSSQSSQVPFSIKIYLFITKWCSLDREQSLLFQLCSTENKKRIDYVEFSSESSKDCPILIKTNIWSSLANRCGKSWQIFFRLNIREIVFCLLSYHDSAFFGALFLTLSFFLPFSSRQVLKIFKPI